MNFTIELPDDFVKAIKLPADEVQGRLKIELAIRLYRKGMLGFGKARELAGLTRWEFHEILGKENIIRHYDVEDLEEDLRTLGELD